MPENAKQSFGRYLRELRQREGLSLLEVSRRSEATVQPVDKGTLSRFESGGQRLALGSLATLCRVYGIEASTLTERYELDAEADRIARVDPEGKTLDQLRAEARRSLLQDGRKWDAYVLTRQSVAHENEASSSEEAAGSRLNLAVVTRSLGKNHLALHELRHLVDSSVLPDRLHPIALERMAHCHRVLGDYERADRLSASALDASQVLQLPRAAAFTHFSHSLLAMERQEFGDALEHLRLASAAYRQATASATDRDGSPPSFEVNLLVSLAEAYLHLGAPERAWRSARMARSMARKSGLPVRAAYADLILGTLEQKRADHDAAVLRWLRSADQGAEVGDRRLEFVSHLHLLRQALKRGQASMAQRQRRKLERLAPWIPIQSEAHRQFRDLTS